MTPTAGMYCSNPRRAAAGTVCLEPGTVTTPDQRTGTTTVLDAMYEVILYNDDENTMEHVVSSLMAVFKHPPQLATRITMEAHYRGRAIAEVEGREAARTHCTELHNRGIMAEARPV